MAIARFSAEPSILAKQPFADVGGEGSPPALFIKPCALLKSETDRERRRTVSVLADPRSRSICKPIETMG
jgi:hypothetical protein